MNITLFISGVTGGGAEKVACALASYLVNQKHQVELVTMLDEEATYPIDSKVSRYSLLKYNERKGFVFNNTLRLLRLVRYLICRKPDTYLVMLPTNTITLLSMRFLTSSKIIAAERANPASYIISTQNKLIKIAHKADGWVFQTKEQENWYNEKCNLKSTIIIPNAINSDVLMPEYKGIREKIIVTAGRLTDQKNHLLLINAFSRIAKKYDDFMLVIYGEGPNRDVLTDRIKELELTGRVLIPGYSPDILQNIRKASLFVLSSDYEGMPNALMEAMALGLPCVSTDCDGGGSRYLIEDGKNGLLVPVKNEIALADAIDKVLSDKEFAYSLGRDAYKLSKTLAPEIIYGQWEKYIKSIIERQQ